MSKPTIVLVHGAFGDASSWRPVFDLLDDDESHGHRGRDSPARGRGRRRLPLERVIDQIDGPVVLVGHSYAGS